MQIFDYIFTGLSILAVLIILVYALKTKKFFKTILINAILGWTTLLILYAAFPITNFRIELTPYTVGASGIFGLPAVVAMAIVNMVFGL